MRKYYKSKDGKCWYNFEPKNKAGLVETTESEWKKHIKEKGIKFVK